MAQETAKERIYREALENVSRSLPVNSELDLVIGEALIKAKYLPDGTGENKAEKLQEQLNTAKKALTEMRNAFGGATFIDSKNKLHSVSEYVSDVLAAIGGENE